ncbi:hypothetical protein SLE2022_161000 [Rubroshorea leprosula]
MAPKSKRRKIDPLQSPCRRKDPSPVTMKAKDAVATLKAKDALATAKAKEAPALMKATKKANHAPATKQANDAPAAKKAKDATPVKTSTVFGTQGSIVDVRIQQARNFAVAEAQKDGCTGNYKIFDSPFGNFLVPVVPSRAELAG